ncbi:hypothetical protein BC835DRAFT_1420050 [Cytidiella melzeri]|nr:hypothetical protein BC835DRAFT_1420050 [Cytidiella melzeri]
MSTNLTLWVLAPDLPDTRLFSVDVRAEDTIDKVAKIICQEYQDLDPVKCNLYKVGIVHRLSRVYTNIRTQCPGVLRRPAENLYKRARDERHKFQLLEPDSKVGEQDWDDEKDLCVKVFIVSTRGVKRARAEDSEDTAAVERLKQVFGSHAPSDIAEARIFMKYTTGPNALVACNRPYSYKPIPFALLDEAFGDFEVRCQQPPSDAALEFANELAVVACQWHPSESQRVDELWEVIERHTGLYIPGQTVPGSRCTTDGNLSVNIMPACIRDCKNEYGNALNQAIAYYGMYLSRVVDSVANYETRFPCILMINYGSTLAFYGATWNRQVTVQPLAMPFELSTTHYDERNRHALASCLTAFKTVATDIEARYKNILNAGPSDTSVVHARRFPYKTSFNGGNFTIRYTERLSETKLLFRAANAVSPSCYVVKFSRRYSATVHQLLAARGHAPRLLHCEPITGNWLVIVMDESQYTALHDIPRLTTNQKDEICRRVEDITRELHEAGYVHGDIRTSNLLVDPASLAGELKDVKVHFIDFDWSGAIGQARYPLGVNSITVKRPDGARGGELITTGHDMDMVSYLFNPL